MKISIETVRADFNDPTAVIHYARAAHFLGLWASEQILVQRLFPQTDARILEAGCGAGRVTLGLWQLGYRDLTAFDLAEELVDQARRPCRRTRGESHPPVSGRRHPLVPMRRISRGDVGNDAF